MYGFTMTYDKVTPESAEHGDTAENGWCLPGGWRHALRDDDGHHESVLEEAKAGEFDQDADTLRELVDVLKEIGACHRSGDSFYGHPSEMNPRDGSVETLCVHVKGDVPEYLLECLAIWAGVQS